MEFGWFEKGEDGEYGSVGLLWISGIFEYFYLIETPDRIYQLLMFHC